MRPLTREDLVRYLPQKPPMRYVSEVLEVDDGHILAWHAWPESECAGHFPNGPIVPGIKIIEFSTQTGIVAWAMWFLSHHMKLEEMAQLIGVFSEIERGAFRSLLKPGERAFCRAEFGEEGHCREPKIAAEVTVRKGDPVEGPVVFEAFVSGIFIPWWQAGAGGPLRQ